MRQPVPNNGMQARIAEQNLDLGPGGGITLSIGADGFTQKHECHATIPLCVNVRPAYIACAHGLTPPSGKEVSEGDAALS